MRKLIGVTFKVMILFQYHPVYKNQPIVACKSFVLSNYQDNCNYTQHPCNVLFIYISFASKSNIGHVCYLYVHFDQKKFCSHCHSVSQKFDLLSMDYEFSNHFTINKPSSRNSSWSHSLKIQNQRNYPR